jgi:hypothetical protein
MEFSFINLKLSKDQINQSISGRQPDDSEAHLASCRVSLINKLNGIGIAEDVNDLGEVNAVFLTDTAALSSSQLNLTRQIIRIRAYMYN